MNTSRSTLSALFGAIMSLATMFVSLFKSADDAIGMLDVAVQDAKHRQTVRSAVDRHNYAKTYLAESAKRLAESRRSITEFKNRGKDHESAYERAYNELSKALDDRLNEKPQS